MSVSVGQGTLSGMTRIPEGKQADVPTVDAAGIADDEPILDVRDDAAWSAGHAPSAVHISIDELEERVGEVRRDGRVVVSCGGGSKATRAVAFLRAEGIDAVVLDGGMRGWQSASRPMTRE